MSMDYFRRPVLVGNTLRRTQNATIRGSVRRSDADGVSTTPYFPGISGKSLQIKIESTTYTVNFVSDDFATALAAINAVIGGHGAGIANGEARDSDGTITIISTSTDGSGNPLRSLGSVEIVGGTAAAILGLDITFHTLKAIGGEIDGAPEGRIGNPFRTALIGNAENITADSVNRGTAMLASNMDVLYAGYNREDAMLMQASFSQVASHYLTVDGSIPIGFGLLSGSSQAKDLAPFFQIIDLQTGQPHASRVVGVVKGIPPAAYPTGWPYTDQTVWTDNLGYNLLGQQVQKMPTAVAITSIVEGRYVTCAGTPFTNVDVEDFVEISGATNLDQLNNNGHKWVVERVISSSIIAVRPMSKGELAMVGFSPTDVQPGIELASTKQLAQSYGNIMVRTGAYATCPVTAASDINLVVSPPILVGSAFQLWVARPMCLMDSGPYDMQSASGQFLKTLASDLDSSPNGLLSAPSVSLSGPNLIVGSFFVRWHGRVIRVGADSYLPPVDAYAESIVYWDPDTNSVKLFTSATTPGTYNPTSIFSGDSIPTPETSGIAFPIAWVASTTGSFTAGTLKPSWKLENGKRCTITVGYGGDCDSLSGAIAFMEELSHSTSETLATNGLYPHFEIVLLSDQTQTNYSSFDPLFTITAPSVTIRGVNKNIKLRVGSSQGVFAFSTSGSLTLEDLTLELLGDEMSLVQSTTTYGDSSRVVCRNLSYVASSPKCFYDLVTSLSSDTDVLLEDCALPVGSTVVNITNAALSITISRCSLWYVNISAVVPRIIGGTNNFDSVVMRDCYFSGGWVLDGTNPLVVDSGAGTYVTVENCRFYVATMSSAISTILMRIGGNGLVKNCRMVSGAITSAVLGSAKTIVEGCLFTSNTQSAPCIQAGWCLNNKLTHVDVDSGVSGGTAVSLPSSNNIAEGNDIQGPFTVGVKTGGSGECVVRNNKIHLYYMGVARPYFGIDVSNDTQAVVSGNSVTVECSGFTVAGINSENSTNNIITENIVYIANPTANSITSYGIDVIGSTAPVVSLNAIQSIGTQSAYTANPIIGIAAASSTNAVISGNNLVLDGAATGTHYGIDCGGSGTPALNIAVTGNSSKVYGSPFYCIDNNLTQVIDGNVFEATKFGVGSTRLSGVVSNNNFIFSGGAGDHACVLGTGTFTGNRFGPVTFSMTGVGGIQVIQMTGNKVFGSFTMAMGSTFAWVEFSNNHFSENTTDAFSVSADYIDFRMSGGRAAVATISNTSGDTYLQNVGFHTLALTNGANSDSSARMHSCKVNSTFSITSRNFLVNGCTFEGVGTHTFNGNNTANSVCAEVSSCVFLSGTINVTNTAVFSLLSSDVGCSAVYAGTGVGLTGRIASCVFTYSVAITFNTAGSVDSCSFKQGANIAARSVNACHFSQGLVMSGFDLLQSVTDCSLNGTLQFTGDAGDGTSNAILVSGNRIIIDAANVHGIVFPSFSGTKIFYEITINNNFIFLGKTYGNAIQASCIYFPVGVHNTTIVGNNLLIKSGGADPGGTGTFSYGVIESATGELRNCVISSNRIQVFHTLAGYNFRSSALLLSYKYVKTSDAQGAAGAGNVMNENGGISAAGTEGGGVFHAGAGVFTIP